MRRWLAWKLRCIAQRIYDAEWHESITVISPAGPVEISIVSDEYGCGVSALNAWRAGEFIEWSGAVRMRDWLASE